MTGYEPATAETDPTLAVTVDFARIAQALFAAGTVRDTLVRVVGFAVETIEGCDHAGIFLIEADEVVTPVLTDPVVGILDAIQSRTGQGPCPDAIARGLPSYADDLADDLRWPRFSPEAIGRGVRSVVALPLLGDPPGAHRFGALNLYAGYPRAFGMIDRAKGLLLAGLASVAYASARSHEADLLQAANLHAALATREVIGQAQGILIERERITADQAFDILRRASQHLNLKLRAVAQTLVDTGERPDIGPSAVPPHSSPAPPVPPPR